MSILGASGQRRVVAFRDCAFQRGAEFVPSLPEINLARAAEHAVGELAGAEAVEADQLRLFLGRRRPILFGNAVGDEDRRDIGAGAILPGCSQPAVAVEIEVCPKPRTPDRRCHGEGRSRRRRHGVRIVVIGGGWAEAAESGHAKPEAGRKRARAKHI